MMEEYMKHKDKISFDNSPNISYKEISNNPIMDIAARFWSDERYHAFKILYKSFRIIDDLVDNKKISSYKISEIEKQKLILKVENWAKSVKESESINTFQKELVKTIVKFRIPIWPWEKFSRSMAYDIHNKGFKTFQIFLNYAEGAVIAPASIFLHLCGLKENNGHYYAPDFNIREATESAALFAYIVHIIRDFQKDQKNNLIFFTNDLLEKNGVDYQMLKEISVGSHIPPSFRNLIKDYYDYAEYYRKKTRLTINKIKKYLEPRYQLSLEIIYNLYLQIFERIDIQNGKFTINELNPSPTDIKNRIDLVTSNFISYNT
jgi:phytoene/squalene synthetase